MDIESKTETNLAHTIGQTEFEACYDAAAKKLLANKQVLAQILQSCVSEYKDCSVQEIAERYIEGEPKVGNVGVHLDDTHSVIRGRNNEDSTLTEGILRYDVLFDAIAPDTSGNSDTEQVIRLIINVEAQTKFRTKYPLTKRAVYYCARMLSSQHGPVFTSSEYGKIRKVYSIWICTRPPKKYQNTLTRYALQPEPLIGNAVEKPANYDLLNVVMACLGEPNSENYDGVLKFLEVLLSSTRTAAEKKDILESDFGVAMNETLESEVLDVCNLSQGVMEDFLEKGRAEGIGVGKIQMLAELVREGELPIDLAARKANMTIEQFRLAMDDPSMQA